MAIRRHVMVCAAACVLAALAACIPAKPPEIDPLAPPSDYRKQILNFMYKVLPDPSGMRDAAITELAVTPVGNVSLYTACVRFNPRKSRTEYEGVQERFAIFHGGFLTPFIPAAAGQCAKAAWQPFPELEKLCFGERCKGL